MIELPTTDEQTLERFGYRQELKRSLGYFSRFALNFSVISVTTGLFANYGDSLLAAGQSDSAFRLCLPVGAPASWATVRLEDTTLDLLLTILAAGVKHAPVFRSKFPREE